MTVDCDSFPGGPSCDVFPHFDRCDPGDGTGGGGGSGVQIDFVVLDAVTLLPIPGVAYLVYRGLATLLKSGLSSVRGKFSVAARLYLTTPPISYLFSYSVTKTGYLPISKFEFRVEGSTTITILMTPLSDICSVEILDLRVGGDGGEDRRIASVKLFNNGAVPVDVTSANSEVALTYISPLLPITIPVGQYIIFDILAVATVDSKDFVFQTSCGPVSFSWPDPPEPPPVTDRVYSFQFSAESNLTGDFHDSDPTPVISGSVDGSPLAVTVGGSDDSSQGIILETFPSPNRNFVISVPTYGLGNNVTGRNLSVTIFNFGPDNMQVNYEGPNIIGPGDSFYRLILDQSGSDFPGTTIDITVN